MLPYSSRKNAQRAQKMFGSPEMVAKTNFVLPVFAANFRAILRQ